MKIWLEAALIVPLAGAVFTSTVSSALGNRLARLLCLVPLVVAVLFWMNVDAGTVLAIPLTEGVWLPGIPVDFSLGVTGLAVPFWLLAQATACVAIWQSDVKRSGFCAPTLLFIQFCLTILFTSQDLILFAAAVQAFWLALLFNSQTEERGPADAALPFVLAAGALFLISAAILGALHLEQFQTFSTRLPALRELSLSTETVWGEFTLAEILFAMMALATTLLAPVTPAHGWLRSLLSGQSRAPAILVVGIAPALAVFTCLQWVVPVLPEAYATATPWMLCGLTLAAVYGAASALSAEGVFEWLAGAAIVHTALALVGVALGNSDGAAGAALHALLWPAAGVGLACLFGWLESAFGTRRAEDIGSLVHSAPRVSILLGLFFLAAIGAPLSGLFPSVILILSGVLQSFPALGLGLAIAWALLVCSAFRLGRGFFFGACPHQGIRTVPDLRWRRVAAAALLLLVSVWAGVWPQGLKSKTDPALKSYWKVPLKAGLTAPGGRT